MNFKVSCLETSLFTRYCVNYHARNRPEKFRGFRETHASFRKKGCRKIPNIHLEVMFVPRGGTFQANQTIRPTEVLVKSFFKFIGCVELKGFHSQI